MQFALPEGFTLEPGSDNPALDYEAELREPTDQLRVRLSIRPLAALQLQFDDPHSAAPEPNHVFAMMFRAIVEELSPTGVGLESELAPKALEPFGASWGALVVIDLREEIAPGFDQGILLALHLEDAADAYVLFLPRDLEAQAKQIQACLRCLTFVPPEPGSEALDPAPEAAAE